LLGPDAEPVTGEALSLAHPNQNGFFP